jgi:hydroxymethylglutaryl-CoA reductase
MGLVVCPAKFMNDRTSRVPGFYRRSLQERADHVALWAELGDKQLLALSGESGLNLTQADHMIENVVGTFALPLGIGLNLVVNGRDTLVPMVIEEPSVVAGASYAAKLLRDGGGVRAWSTEPIMIGQIQVLEVANPSAAEEAIGRSKLEILELADRQDPFLVHLGGGARDVRVRHLEQTEAGPMMVVELLMDCRDAMGANTVNTACEALTPMVERLTGGRVNLRILSNLADQRLAGAEGSVPADSLATEDLTGELVMERIVEAAAFAEADPYRAATHNKGIMNGIDAVVLATGNDWRAVEAGAHAYAARDGRYTALSHWWVNEAGELQGRLELPLAVGMVGGATRVHPAAQAALRVLGAKTGRELAEVMAAVGLAQNLAALRALATTGIQAGHMRLHARQLATAAGASGDKVDRVVQQMVDEGIIRLDRAQEIVRELASS